MHVQDSYKIHSTKYLASSIFETCVVCISNLEAGIIDKDQRICSLRIRLLQAVQLQEDMQYLLRCLW